MLSVSGLQAALKRRNSKVHKDTVAAPGNLGLSSALRQFSSSEVLNPHLSPPPAPSVATVARKSSFSRRIRKVSTGHNQSEAVDGCTALDMHIAQIKRKLVSSIEILGVYAVITVCPRLIFVRRMLRSLSVWRS